MSKYCWVKTLCATWMESVHRDCAQGVSSAGLQHGMKDDRSGLIRAVVNVFDSLDRPERLGDHSSSLM